MPSAGVTFLGDEGVAAACGTLIGFTTRHGGISEGAFASLNLSTYVGDVPEHVQANRRRVLQALGARAAEGRLIVPKQVHGSEVLVADDVARTQQLAEQGADAVVCACAGVPVILTFADCVPVILVAPGGAFAVVHSGWRGTYAGIAGKALGVLATRAGCEPGACNAYIGPHIGSCCYEVDSELLGMFCDRYGQVCNAGASHLKLEAAVRLSLLVAGADAQRIASAGICTSCSVARYFSYRAEDGNTGRHGAVAYREEP